MGFDVLPLLVLRFLAIQKDEVCWAILRVQLGTFLGNRSRDLTRVDDRRGDTVSPRTTFHADARTGRDWTGTYFISKMRTD
jgi:hypothetical protein